MIQANEKLIRDIIDNIKTDNISIEELKSILCKVVRMYNIQEIRSDRIDSPQILIMYKQDMELQEFAVDTIKNKMYTLNNFIRFIDKDIEDITTLDIKVYLSEQKKSLQSSTINGYIDTLRAFFTWAVEEDIIKINPLNKIKKLKESSKVREPLNIEDIEKLRMSCNTHRERALIEFLLCTGMRVSEIAKVNVSDLDFSTNRLKTIGKGNKERIIFFNDKCKLYLQEYLNNRKGDGDALFIYDKKPYGRLTSAGLRKILKNIAKRKVADTNVYPHRFRHTFATQLFANGADITTIQFLLGHNNIATTQIYAHTPIDKVEYEYNRYSANL